MDTVGREGTGSNAAPRAPSRLPLRYFALAHLCLGAAFAVLAVRPVAFTGFFYHPTMMVPVHLVTLGWISASILGALYMIAPMALRTRLAEGGVDRWAFWCYAVGVSGMVSHFWIESYAGLIWSAPLVLFALVLVGLRTTKALLGARLALGVKAHVLLAFLNVLGAAGLGLLVALGRLAWLKPLLPGSALVQVYAHLHLAAVGWATMMVFGVGYRLLPMLLPAAMPPAWGSLATAVCLEVGTLGLVAGNLARPRWIVPAALLVVAAVTLFLGQVMWMRQHRRPRARDLPRPDFGLLHVLQALVCLLASVALGVSLLVLPTELRLRLMPVYGTLGLVGFLAQMVLGVGHRLLPLYGWFRTFAKRGLGDPPPPPYRAMRRQIATATFVLWSAGVPLLAVAFYLEAAVLIRVSASMLLAAVVTNVVQLSRLVTNVPART